jgi:Ca2+-binding EF-hand superfamily protein
MLLKSLILSASAVMVASTAWAFMPSQFIGIDRNADNMVSREEARDYRQRYFDSLDENSDGIVEFEEYVKAKNLRSAVANTGAEVKVTEEYAEADQNSDTKLTPEEFFAVGDKRFNLLDTDKDGFVSQKEFISPGL